MTFHTVEARQVKEAVALSTQLSTLILMMLKWRTHTGQ